MRTVCNMLVLSAALSAADIDLPASAVLVDVTKAPWLAVGDGVHDDTAAIQAAVAWALDINRNYFTTPPVVYLPAGVYRLTGPIEGRVGSGTSDWHNGMILMGRSRTGTVLRLDARASGFGNAANLRSLIRPASDHSAGSGPVESSTTGWGNRAFRNAVINLTVEIGAGNPGCVAIDFLASNRGCVEDVTIRAEVGSGATGIGMDRPWPGPALLHRVRIEGFAYGITMRNHYEYGMTAEDVEIRSPRTAGILVENNAFNIRRLDYRGSAPAILAPGGSGGLTLIDSTVTAIGAPSGAAITTGKRSLVQHLTSTGWTTVLDDQSSGNADISGGSGTTVVGFANAGPTRAVNGEVIAPLGLPVEEVPEPVWPAADQWATVLGSWESLIDAVATGKPGVLLNCRQNSDNGSYWINSTVTLGASAARHVMGTMTTLQRGGSLPSGDPLLRFTGGAGTVVVLEHLNIGGRIEHAGAGTLVLRHCDFGSYRSGSQGRTFLVDCIGSDLQVAAGHKLWARQYNSEYSPAPLNVSAGDCWIFGYKTEGEITNWRNDGGALALLGAYPRPSNPTANNVPLFINADGAMDANYVMGYADNSQAPWTLQFREEDGSTTTDLLRSSIGNGGQTYLVSRTSAGRTSDTTAPATPGSLGLASDGRGQPVLSGTAEASATLLIWEGSVVLGTAKADPTGAWQWTPSLPLAAGTHALQAQAADAAGNRSALSGSQNASVMVDTTAPARPAAPTIGGGNSRSPVLRGTGEPGATCQIRDGDTLLGSTIVHDDGTWSWEGTALLSTGVHQLTVTLVDLQGNSSPASDPTTLTISSSPAGGGSSSDSGSGGCGLGGALTALLAALGLALYRRR